MQAFEFPDTPVRSRPGRIESGRFAGRWRFRVGDYRLIADIQNRCLCMLKLDIGHRRDVYR